ncbi:CobW family GTP-binding protein [Sphingosinicella soli]|uniref:G3E family GTPase n=1 Tax=Sphingosinicella soli TaxID=333708 RepID=A0A7W7F7D6_9SPHN|nr:GTP-binding protein [Sphingosinicella soli]MBB4632569.1 G3E family GTPase [Sphingosinicella soli]
MVWAPEGHFDRHLPFSLLTGFLGSGKTTLLNWVLQNPSLSDTAVAINEFGSIPLDHNFVEAAPDDVIVLANGCMCCFAGDDLGAALARIFRHGERDDIPRFKRLIIETSGLADPEFVLQAILDNPLGGRFLWLDQVVTTVDAVHGLQQLERHREARKQARLADRLIITKADLAEKEDVHALQETLRTINGNATQWLRKDPALSIDRIFSPFFLNEDQYPSMLSEWTRGVRPLPVTCDNQNAHVHHHSHTAEAASATLIADAPLDWRQLHLWLGRMQRAFGENLLRVKGIVNVEGSAEPIVVHAVQSTLHVPVALKAWPDADRRTRIVFMFTGEFTETLQAHWATFLSETLKPVFTEQP